MASSEVEVKTAIYTPGPSATPSSGGRMTSKYRRNTEYPGFVRGNKSLQNMTVIKKEQKIIQNNGDSDLFVESN